jgi:hypothetical protein
MFRFAVCSAALALITWGLRSGLHGLQFLGVWPYLALCTVFCGVIYFLARVYDARNPTQEVLPPEPNDPPLLRKVQHLIPGG